MFACLIEQYIYLALSLPQTASVGFSLLLIERYGRRILLFSSASISCISMTLLGVYFYLEENMCLEDDNLCTSGKNKTLLKTNFLRFTVILITKSRKYESNNDITIRTAREHSEKPLVDSTCDTQCLHHWLQHGTWWVNLLSLNNNTMSETLHQEALI